MVSRTEKNMLARKRQLSHRSVLKSLANKAFKSKQSSKAYIKLIGDIVFNLKYSEERH